MVQIQDQRNEADIFLGESFKTCRCYITYTIKSRKFDSAESKAMRLVLTDTKHGYGYRQYLGWLDELPPIIRHCGVDNILHQRQNVYLYFYILQGIEYYPLFHKCLGGNQFLLSLRFANW